MHANPMSKIVRLDEKELQQLTTEVKETIANSVELQKKTSKKFTEAQMWFRRSKMRSASTRIRL
jgi:hypothetical protein